MTIKQTRASKYTKAQPVRAWEWDTTLQSAAAAAGNGTAHDLLSAAAVALQVTGIFVGTITFEATLDGTNWTAHQGVNTANGDVSTTTTGTGIFIVPVTGMKQFRARVSAYTSGTITVVSNGVSMHGGLSLADIVTNISTLTLSAPSDGTYIGDIKFGEGLPANSGVDIGDVDVLSIAAGENHLGEVGGADTIITVTPTVTAGAYSAGDAVGGELTFANAGRASGLGGIIKSVVFIDDAGQDAETELWLFDTTITAVGDNAAFSQTEAELHTCIAVISSTEGTWRAAGTPSVCDVEVSRGYTCTGTSLFGQLVTRGTPTYAATDDVTVRIQLVQN